MAKTSKRGVRLTDGGYGKRPKHYVPGETSSNKPNKKKKNTMTKNLLNERNYYENRMMKSSFNKNHSYKRKPYRTCRE